MGLVALLLQTAIGGRVEAEGIAPWRSSVIGGGGWIQNVVIAPSNSQRLYAYVDVGGVFRSDDGGRSWRIIHHRLGNRRVRSLSVDPRDENRLILVNGSPTWVQGAWISEDGGETWRQTLRALFEGNGADRAAGLLLARSPVNPDLILAASVDSGVYRSTDNGETWERVPGTEHRYPADIRFDLFQPHRVYLACLPWQWKDRRRAPAFYRSEDEGQTFVTLSERAPTEMAQCPAEPGRLYAIFDYAEIRVSEDGGETWREASEGLPLDSQRAREPVSEHRFSALAAGPDFLLTASTRGTFYRKNAAESVWRRVPREGVEQKVAGEPWFNAPDVRAPADFDFFGAALGSITVCFENPQRWFFTDWAGIYETTDAGRHWALRVDGVEVTVVHDLAPCPADPAVVHLALADLGYFYSTNGGGRFHRVAMPGGGNNVRAIAVSPANPDAVAAVGSGRSGHSWFSNQLFLSHDRGRSWRRASMKGLPSMAEQHGARMNAVEMDPRDARVLYVAVSGPVGEGQGGLYRSEDGGESFAWFSEGCEAGQRLYREAIWGGGRWIAVDTAGNLITIGRDVRRVYARAAGSAAWTRVTGLPDDEPVTVCADWHRPGRFYLAMARAGAFRSDDAGLSWRPIYQGKTASITADQRVPGRVAVAGTARGTLISRDAGEQWTEIGDAGLTIGIGAVLAFAGDRLLAGSDGNGVFWTPLPESGSTHAVVPDPLRLNPSPVPSPSMASPLNPHQAPTSSQGRAPLVVNGDMSEGDRQVRGWTGVWKAEGTLEALRDTGIYHSPPASLQLRSVQGRARGTVWQRVDAQGRTRFWLSAALRVEGPKIEFVELVIQSFNAEGKQLKWDNVWYTRKPVEWTSIRREIRLPEGTKSFSIVLSMTGDGAAWLDDVQLHPTDEGP